jgi:hypothetical protein
MIIVGLDIYYSMSLMLRVTQKPIKRKPSPSGSEGLTLPMILAEHVSLK